MGEWALPSDEGLRFAEILHRAVDEGRPEARWLRGGFWRNFQVKYREINDLHKQMLRASEKVAALPHGRARDEAHDHLYRGQSNDCYWHGLFGGIYLSHMRLATLAHLIAAEDLADSTAREAGQPVDGIRRADLDLDGVDELLLTSPGQVVAVKPSEGGGIGAWDVRAVRHALTSVMRRRPEAYHSKLVAFEEAGGTPATAGVAASIHDVVKVREPGLSKRLWYDAYERRSGLVHLLAPDTTPDAFGRAAFSELGDFVERPFEVRSLGTDWVTLGRIGSVTGTPAEVIKTYRFDGDRSAPRLSLEVSVANRSEARIEAILGLEWAFNMLGGGGNPSAWYEADGVRGAFDAPRVADAVTRVALGNDHLGIAVSADVRPAADAWWSSMETISLSEDGFERNHQGGCLLLAWLLCLEPGEATSTSTTFEVSTTTHHA
jgi:alpha-amylase